jgi:hypothetical protein
MYSTASHASCPDGVLVLRDFLKVVIWPGTVDFKVYILLRLKVLMAHCPVVLLANLCVEQGDDIPQFITTCMSKM